MERWDRFIIPVLPAESDPVRQVAHGPSRKPRSDTPMDPRDEPMDPGRAQNLQPKPFPNDPRRCTATNRGGYRCRRWAIRRGTVCLMHGGGMQRKRLAREREMKETALLVAGKAVESRRGRRPYVRLASLERIRASAHEAMNAHDDAVYACMRLVAEQFRLGRTAAEAATAVGVSMSTVDYWCRDDATFRFMIAMDAERLEAGDLAEHGTVNPSPTDD